MDITKAIEILEDSLHRDSLDDPIDMHAAARLGIEALKHIQRQRKDLMWSEWKPLPGESVN